MQYFRPETLEHALRIKAAEPCQVLAGGTDIYPATDRQTLPGPILDITDIPDLRGLNHTPTGLSIGAATTWADIAGGDLPDAFAAFKQAASEVGSVQIQNVATVGGNLCNASPAADGVPALLIMDAAVELTSVSGCRNVPLGEFILGNRRTAIRPDEILTAIHVPGSAMTGRSRFAKLGARKYLVISIAMVAVRLETNGAQIKQSAISVGACSEVAKRLPSLEMALQGANLDAATELVANADFSDLSPIDDMRGTADYRKDAVAPLIQDCLREIMQNPETVPA